MQVGEHQFPLTRFSAVLNLFTAYNVYGKEIVESVSQLCRQSAATTFEPLDGVYHSALRVISGGSYKSHTTLSCILKLAGRF